MNLPFKEIRISDNVYIRTFANSIECGEFMWHRDREDRIIESIGETDWLLQLDDELPKKIDRQLFIPKGVYHRIIKGSGDLKIRLFKLID